jgi:hypothetical protein
VSISTRTGTGHVRRAALPLLAALLLAPAAQARLDATTGTTVARQQAADQGDRAWPGIDPTDDAHYNPLMYRPELSQDIGPQPIQVVSDPSDGFDWLDAGIGAGVAAGLVVLAGTAVGAGHRRRLNGSRQRVERVAS